MCTTPHWRWWRNLSSEDESWGEKAMRSIADEMFPELSDQEIEELVTNVPPKDRRLITSSVDFSVSTLLSYIREGTILIPEFQRKYIWSQSKASRLLESLIMQCPVPVVYLSRRTDGVLEVVDGNQRLTSIRRFVDGHFSLKGLTAFPELVGADYDSLDPRFQRHIQSKTIRCVIIEPESHPQIKFDVFERLNSGSTPLTAQELRNGIYAGQFIDLLHKMAGEKNFIRLTSIKNDLRMKREELVLRFLAFFFDLEQYEKPLANFLNGFCERERTVPLERAAVMSELFAKSLGQLELALGDKPFRFAGDGKSAAKFNTAYYDALMVGFAISNLAQQDDERIVALRDRIRDVLQALAGDQAFRLNVLRATSDEAAVLSRIMSVRDRLNAIG
jgi:hypothetical protein